MVLSYICLVSSPVNQFSPFVALSLGRCVHRNRSRGSNQNNHKLIADKLWSVSVWYEHNPTLIWRSCLACSTRLSSALFFWSVFWSWQWIFSLQREARQRHQDVLFLSTSDLRVSFCLVCFPNDYCHSEQRPALIRGSMLFNIPPRRDVHSFISFSPTITHTTQGQ